MGSRAFIESRKSCVCSAPGMVPLTPFKVPAGSFSPSALPVLPSTRYRGTPAAGAEAGASEAAAEDSAGAALDEDELDELLQAARASVAAPSTAADFKTVVRFMHSPSHETAGAVVEGTLGERWLRAGNTEEHRSRIVTAP